jgi:hypothetical protein
MAVGWPHSPGDPSQAVRPVPGPGHQAGDLRDVRVVLGAAVLPGARLPLAGGTLRMASSSAAVIIQPQVSAIMNLRAGVCRRERDLLW